jgi:hypothetical protein
METLTQLVILFVVMLAGIGVGWIARGYSDESLRQASKETTYAQGVIDGYLDSLKILEEARRTKQQ